MPIISLSGKKGSGKSTLANMIQKYIPYYQQKSFAGKLKQIASLLTGQSVELFESQAFKNSKMDAMWGDMNFREFLQRLGSDALRDNVHKNIHINALMCDYCSYSSHWIVTDVRFPNEAEAIHKAGGIVIRIERETGLVDNHASETALDNYPLFDVTYNNSGSLEEMDEFAQYIANLIAKTL